MLGKRWVKLALAFVAVLVVLAVASPFVADILVTERLKAHGVAWTKVDRSGFTWRFSGLTAGPASAANARFTLSTRPELNLSNVSIDAAAVLSRPIDAALLPPAGLYIGADPVTLMWGEHMLASGMRGRIADGRIVATGPTMSVKGTLGEQLVVDIDGQVSFAGVELAAKGKLTYQSAFELAFEAGKVKLSGDAVGREVLILEPVSGRLKGSTTQADGALEFAGAKGSLELSCPGSDDCALSVSLGEMQYANAMKQLAELSSTLAKARVKGQVSGTARFDLNTGKSELKLQARRLSATRTGVAVDDLMGGDFAHFVMLANGKRVEHTSGDEAVGWVPMADLPAYVPAAVVAALDPGFAEHNGYDMTRLSQELSLLVSGEPVPRYAGTLTEGLVLRLLKSAGRPSLTRARCEYNCVQWN